MTKRFELYYNDYFVGAYDNVTQEKINVLKSIDLLNSLSEENEQLRQIATRTEEEKEHYADLYNELAKELEKIPPKIREVWLDE